MITSHTLCTVAGLSYRQVDHWTRTGYISPVDDPTPGQGHQRLFDDDQVALAVQMGRLTRIGFPAGVARNIATQILAAGQAAVDGYQITPVYSVGEPLNAPKNVGHLDTTGDTAA